MTKRSVLISNWGVSSMLISSEAEKIGYTTEIINKDKNLFYLVNNKTGEKYLFKNIDCGLNSALGLKVGNDKELVYDILGKNNITIPNCTYITNIEHNQDSFKLPDIKYPVITKPIDSGHGNGVRIDIKNIAELKSGIDFSFKYSDKIVIQNMILGNEYRVFVIGDEVVGVVNRIPPDILGDGQNNIETLINIENEQNPKRTKDLSKGLGFIKVDEELISTISEKGYKLDSILPKGEKLTLRRNSNISTGGISIDYTDKMCDEIKKEAIKATKLCGLKIAGVDVMTTDISKSLKETNGAIIEINPTPSVVGHHLPGIGTPRNIAKKILDLRFKK